MQNDKIIIRGAKENNLKNISLELPRNKFIVFTGLSGSGKSSLAFDTIYAEGQRRYVESLSSYARQFLGQMDKPDVEYIEGLSPSISIDQKTTSKNPRSTVGTVTEIYDYLRLLYARIGTPYCPKCGKEITSQTVDQMVDSIMELEDKTRLQVLAPVIRGKKGDHINGVGTYNPDMQEIDPYVLINGDKIYVDTRDGVLNESGDFIIPIKENQFSESDVTGELGELILGKIKGRENDDEITIFKTVGSGVLDVVTAKRIYDKAVEKGIGEIIDF